MVNADELAKALAQLVVALDVGAQAPQAAAGMQRRQQVLLVQVFQNTGHAAGKLVVEQDGAGVEVFHHQTGAHALRRLQRDAVAARQLQRGVLADVRADGAHAHVQTGHVEDAPQLRQAAQVGRRAHLVLRHDEQVAGLGADFLDGRHGGLYGQRQRRGCEVVPAVRRQAGGHGGELEAGIAHVHGTVEGRRVLHPLQAKPALDGGRGIQQTLLEFVDRAAQGPVEVRNHVQLLVSPWPRTTYLRLVSPNMPTGPRA